MRRVFFPIALAGLALLLGSLAASLPPAYMLLAAFLYLLGAVFKLAWRRFRETQDPYQCGLVMGFLAGYVGLIVHIVGVNTFIIVRIMEPFWFFVGVIAVMPMLQPEAAAADASPLLRGRCVPFDAHRLPAPPRLP